MSAPIEHNELTRGGFGKPDGLFELVGDVSGQAAGRAKDIDGSGCSGRTQNQARKQCRKGESARHAVTLQPRTNKSQAGSSLPTRLRESLTRS